MKHMTRRSMFSLVLMTLLALSAVAVTVSGQSSATGNPLVGAWRVTEIADANGPAITNPQPGLYIFTGKHYSLVRDTSLNPRVAIRDSSNVTAPEALATFGPFIAQSGTYDLSGTRVNVTPVVAKFPASGEKHRTSTWDFELQGDTLSMTYLIGRNATTVRLTRVE